MAKQEQQSKTLIAVFGAEGQLGCSLEGSFTTFSPSPFIYQPILLSECNFEKEGAITHTIKRLQQKVEEYGYEGCIVVNAAAYTQVDKAEEEKDKAYCINVNAVEELAQEVAAQNWAMVHISTDYVFDGQQQHPYTTTDTPHPKSVYGITKANGEKALTTHLTRGNGLTIRTSWLYSPYGKNFVKTMLRLSKERNELQVVNDQFGSPTYAPHLADFIVLCCNHYLQKGAFPAPLLHYCNQGIISWFQFAKAIIRLADRETECTVHPITTAEYPTQAKRPNYSALACNESWGTFYPWEEALKRCIERLRTREPELFTRE